MKAVLLGRDWDASAHWPTIESLEEVAGWPWPAAQALAAATAAWTNTGWGIGSPHLEIEQVGPDHGGAMGFQVAPAAGLDGCRPAGPEWVKAIRAILAAHRS